jgi:hypothetical protein
MKVCVLQRDKNLVLKELEGAMPLPFLRPLIRSGSIWANGCLLWNSPGNSPIPKNMWSQ